MKSMTWALLMVVLVAVIAAVVAAVAGVSLVYHAVIALGVGLAAAVLVLFYRRASGG